MYRYIPLCLCVDVPATHGIVWLSDITEIAYVY